MIVAVYARGSATPVEIARAARPLGGVTFVVEPGRDPFVEGTLPLLRRLGRVITVDDESLEDTAIAIGSQALGLVTFADTTQLLASRLAARLGCRFHDEPTARLLIDKLAQRTRLRETGLCRVDAVPTGICAGDLPTPQLPYPFVIKPRSGSGSEQMALVRDASDFVSAATTLDLTRDYLAETLMTAGEPIAAGLADYVSVESLAGETILHLGITARLPLAPPFRETGAVFPYVASGILEQDMYALAERAIRAVGLESGLVHTEIKLSDDGPQVVEVNGRLGGKIAGLMSRVGMDDPVAIAVRASVGAPRPPRLRRARGVALDYWHQPPVPATSIDALPDLRDVTTMPGVCAARATVRAGSPVDWRLGTKSRVAEIELLASSHRDVMDRYRNVRRFLDAHSRWGGRLS
ncbi:hypothetical protein BH10ACT8_BH10ACT8_08460 [soil metagenome]